MTIDEAIEHAKELASTCDDRQCAADHAQLAEWLRQARGADKAARWYTEKIRKLEAENAMLRERLLESREANEHLFTELRRYKSIFRMKPRAMNALFDENSKLREEIEAAKHDLQVFSMRSVQLDAENAKLRTQLADVIESMGRVEERCAKLRELVREVWRSCPVDEDDCKKCPHYIVESDEVWCDIPIRMRELGIEVPE